MSKRILIVEDEESIADLEKDYLELSGFEVEIENDGTKGLERALHEEFDLFILDLMLPGVDGFEICKKIRETKNTPILMVSAKKDDIDKIRGLGLGADDYVTKPFSPSELVARVKAHLARYERLIGSNMPQNDIIEIRGIKIDKTARRVWVNGEEKQFTTKEFDLLTFLAENPNHVFTKEELFRKIWDMESIGDIATVTVHIKKIREKIEMNTNKPQYSETSWSAEKLRHTAATLMYQTGNVDILTLKQLLGHSSVGTTQIYTHLQEFQVRSAIEENPLGKVLPMKAAKASLDTSEAEGKTSSKNIPAEEDVPESSGPMAAFEGAAQDGFRADISAMSAEKTNDSSNDT